MMTSAPSRVASSAVERPMPDEPPTTTTFLAASILLSFWSQISWTKRSARRSSSRFELLPDSRLASPEPRKLPDPGAGGVDIGSDIDVDQIGLFGPDALAAGP